MTFNTGNSSILFETCTSCYKFNVSLIEEFLKDNQRYFSFDAIDLKIGTYAFDLLPLFVIKITEYDVGNTIDVVNGSQIVTGTDTLFTEEFSDGDYIGINNGSNTFFYKILEVVSDLEITLVYPYYLTDDTGLEYYRVSYNAIIEYELPDALYSVELTFSATDTSSVQQEYQMISQQLFYCHAQCCLDAMFAMLPAKLCDSCNYEQFIKDLMLLQSLVVGLGYATCCPDDTKINHILGLITKICNYNNCTTC